MSQCKKTWHLLALLEGALDDTPQLESHILDIVHAGELVHPRHGITGGYVRTVDQPEDNAAFVPRADLGEG